MLAVVSFDYAASGIVKKLSREDYLRLREEVPQLNLYDWPEGKNDAPDNYLHRDVLIDLATDGHAIAAVGLPFQVKRFKGTYRAATAPMPDRPGATYAIHVAIPAIGLLSIDEVMVLDDPCTNDLQRHLEKGWRIIAVCPPDAQRRPDYILGRSPEMRASRGGDL